MDQTDLEMELEALSITYDDAVEDVGADSQQNTRICLDCRPRSADAEHECYVTGKLVLTVGCSYPETAPNVTLEKTKGRWLLS